jgi:uncharacterized protein YabN with tetrapyrrole methylase and pyrophosphatase domain
VKHALALYSKLGPLDAIFQMETSSPKPELFIIGLGVVIPDHVMAQSRRALSRCSRVYSIVQEPAAHWMPKEALGQTQVINALDYYVDGGLRSDNYDRIAREIIRAAADAPVAYVTYGNPMAYDRVAHNLVQYAREAAIPVHVVPGISSLDTIMCDLRVDMAPAIQVYEASWMFVCQMTPQVDVPLLLLQVGNFGSLRAHYGKRRDGSSVTELAEYLCRFYPRSHSVSLVRSTAAEDHPARVRQVKLEDLGVVTAEDLSGASMYVPSLKKAVPNPEILLRMKQQ